jgi:hypothetical protein
MEYKRQSINRCWRARQKHHFPTFLRSLSPLFSPLFPPFSQANLYNTLPTATIRGHFICTSSNRHPVPLPAGSWRRILILFGVCPTCTEYDLTIFSCTKYAVLVTYNTDLPHVLLRSVSLAIPASLISLVRCSCLGKAERETWRMKQDDPVAAQQQIGCGPCPPS